MRCKQTFGSPRNSAEGVHRLGEKGHSKELPDDSTCSVERTSFSIHRFPASQRYTLLLIAASMMGHSGDYGAGSGTRSIIPHNRTLEELQVFILQRKLAGVVVCFPPDRVFAAAYGAQSFFWKTLPTICSRCVIKALQRRCVVSLA